MSRPTNFWTFPIETVSQSEGGFELVHQSVVVMPHWLVEADKEGRWSVTMQMSLDTSRAEKHNNHPKKPWRDSVGSGGSDIPVCRFRHMSPDGPV